MPWSVRTARIFWSEMSNCYDCQKPSSIGTTVPHGRGNSRNKISFNKNEKKTKSCWHTVYSYGKIVNVAERTAGKYNIGADLASEKNKKTSWHKWSDVIIYKSCWRRTIRTIEIRSERRVKKFLTDEIRNDII